MSKNFESSFGNYSGGNGEAIHASFIVVSSEVIPVSLDNLAPSIFTGLSPLSLDPQFTLNSVMGSVRNVSGETIGTLTGSISFQPERSGGGLPNELYLWSEKSLDGVTWAANPNSLRKIEIPSDGETFKTAVSLSTGWLDGEYLRFKMYTVGGGTISINPSATTVDTGVVDGYSVVWEMSVS